MQSLLTVTITPLNSDESTESAGSSRLAAVQGNHTQATLS